MSIRQTIARLGFVLTVLAPWASAAPMSGAVADIAAPAAAAAWTVEQDLTVAQGRGMSLSQAVEQVRRRYPGGRIVDAKTKRSGNREVHEIKVLTSDGRVKTERISGRTLERRG